MLLLLYLGDLNKRARDGRPSALKMLQAMWLLSKLWALIISKTPNCNENNFLLPDPENLEPDSHKIECTFEGARSTKMVWPTCTLGEITGSWQIGSLPSRWPADIVVNTLVFIVKGTLIMLL